MNLNGSCIKFKSELVLSILSSPIDFMQKMSKSLLNSPKFSPHRHCLLNTFSWIDALTFNSACLNYYIAPTPALGPLVCFPLDDRMVLSSCLTFSFILPFLHPHLLSTLCQALHQRWIQSGQQPRLSDSSNHISLIVFLHYTSISSVFVLLPTAIT